ncbi:F0F1 ATP synthase subunit epsilon [Candidatus Saccharibacteria bacterium]|nr:F0F1 ATP synthase subunit epsilon [Candidatus Saccharibacteria bacterium]
MADKDKPEENTDGTSKAVSSGSEDTIHLKVYSPYKQYYDGPALSVSAESATGPFDILPKHHNFITLLQPCAVHVRKPDGEQTIDISGGVLHVKADKIVVFLDV